MSRTGLTALAGAAIILTMTSAVVPAATDDAETCTREHGDAAIMACTRAIGSHRYAGRDLDVLHYDRGTAYYLKGDFDHAITDFDQVIRNAPRYAIAFNGRAAAYQGKGDFDRAIAGQPRAWE